MSSSPSMIARRYAKALFESYEPAKLEAAQVLIADLAKVWAGNEILRTALLNPGVPIAERMLAFEEIASKVGQGDSLLINLSKVILENGRLSYLPEIAAAFALFVDMSKKRLALEIVSAFELDASERDSILAKVKQDLGGLATIKWSTDSSLIGGLRIRAGDLLLDSSIVGALNDLRESLGA